MSLSFYVKLTCWTSIVALLWLRVFDFIPNNATVWGAFLFFCVVGVIAYSMGIRK